MLIKTYGSTLQGIDAIPIFGSTGCFGLDAHRIVRQGIICKVLIRILEAPTREFLFFDINGFSI